MHVWMHDEVDDEHDEHDDLDSDNEIDDHIDVDEHDENEYILILIDLEHGTLDEVDEH